jgi:hypothetical protein
MLFLDLRFSQTWLWRLSSSEMWCCVVQHKFTSLHLQESKNKSRKELARRLQAEGINELWVNFCCSIWCHSPEDNTAHNKAASWFMEHQTRILLCKAGRYATCAGYSVLAHVSAQTLHNIWRLYYINVNISVFTYALCAKKHFQNLAS